MKYVGLVIDRFAMEGADSYSLFQMMIRRGIIKGHPDVIGYQTNRFYMDEFVAEICNKSNKKGK